MSIKTFFITLLIVFILYEVCSITIGVIKEKKKQKNSKESEEKENATTKTN